jgi:2-keto-4-pentenoate hydratase/2-oxohepta-3-ene-1,7-dioic acid hydratase in catechol pathway
MRLVTFEIPTPLGAVRRTGAWEGDTIIDLQFARALFLDRRSRARAAIIAAAEIPADMLELLKGGDYALELAREALAQVIERGDDRFGTATLRHDEGSVRLLAPLPRPNSLRDFLVFEEHLRNCLRTMGVEDSFPPEWYNLPAHYKGNPDAIYGPEDVVPYPPYTERLDFELEVCAVVGASGYRVKSADAASHIFGYTLYNDWSARDHQRRESSVGIGPGISKDFASSIGPCIVTADAFDTETARLEARVNGEQVAAGTLANMHFSFEEIIEYASQEATIQPGDLLGSGTIGGGCGLEFDRYLDPGSTVELWGEGIGTLRNRVERRV